MALKIVYKICCGIDVHKTFVVAYIASTDPKGVTTYESHRFSTYTRGLKNLLPLSPSQKASRSQESNHCHSKNASYRIIPYVEERRKL